MLVAALVATGAVVMVLYAPKPGEREAEALAALRKANQEKPDQAKPDKAKPDPSKRTITATDLAETYDKEKALLREAIFQVKSPEEKSRAISEKSARLDELVLNRLKKLNITPAPPCSDSVFVRRVFLDVIGTLPTAAEARSFLEDKNPEKRNALIESLLQRPEYADYWAMKWADLLRIKSEFPINLWPMAVQAYHGWIRSRLSENMPYDLFVREMITASGSNFLTPQVNFYRAVQRKEPELLAQVVALNFMGVRPETWKKERERWAGMLPFFAKLRYKRTLQWKEEIVLFDPRQKPPEGISTTQAVFPDGTTVPLSPDQDPRKILADWLITPKNPWFTRNITNRVWSWLLGRGIIHEPDDIRPDNPPSNPELLAYLEEQLVAARYDIKELFRLILRSRTYQLSSVAGPTTPEAEANFASYPLRRLEAEVLIDAICQITGTVERYYSPIPEPFTFIPDHVRSISIPDASISSAFLELFGRPPRDTGLESERNNRWTPSQQLHLINSTHIQNKLDKGPKLQALFNMKGTSKEVQDEFYLTILSRYPSEEESELFRTSTLITDSELRPKPYLAWVLINTPEFLFRH
jgi:hypothetical protein